MTKRLVLAGGLAVGLSLAGWFLVRWMASQSEPDACILCVFVLCFFVAVGLVSAVAIVRRPH